jgi:hypothetical protein
VREDPRRKGMLYAGTEIGVFVSFDDGAKWQPLRLNLPQTPIHDLVVKDHDLVVATHGRSFWILDDISALRQMTPNTAAEDAVLFAPSPTVRFRGPGFVIPSGLPVGQNPPVGVIVNYWLKSAPKDKEKDGITLEILDAKGKVVRKYSSKLVAAERSPEEEEFGGPERPSAHLPAEAGLNRFVWDMRYEPPTRVPGAVTWGGRPEGPLAPPGTYQLKLTASGKTLEAKVVLQKDPRTDTSQLDFDKQFELAMRIRDRVTSGHEAVNHIRSVRSQLDALKKRLAPGDKSKPVLDAIEALRPKLDAIEEKIIQPKSKSSEDPLNYPIQTADQLLALQGTVESADTAPTAQSYAVFDELNARLETQLAAWRDLQAKDLAALNDLINKQGIPPVAPAPANTGDGSH